MLSQKNQAVDTWTLLQVSQTSEKRALWEIQLCFTIIKNLIHPSKATSIIKFPESILKGIAIL